MYVCMLPTMDSFTWLLLAPFQNLVCRNTSSIHGGCVWVQSWQAYSCAGLQHHMLVIESMDADTEVRRLSPLALNGGDTGGGHYTDLLNGPMDHGL